MSARLWTIVVVVCAAVALAGCGRVQDAPIRLSGISGWKGAAPNSPRRFTFAVLSDRTGGAIPGVFESAIQQVNLLKPDFVINVGDLIEGYSEDPAKIARMWDEMDGMLAKLDAPFFFCPGNHDVTNSVELAEYIRRHGVNGKTYYSFDYGGSHFVVLDSITPEQKPAYGDEMMDWLAKDMAASRSAQHVFVFAHYPRLNDGDLSDTTKLWKQALALLPKDKTTVFNGHWHNMAAFDEDGVKSYVLSCTGAGVPENGARQIGEYQMFGLVSVDGGKPSMAVLPVGEVRPITIAFDTEDVYRLTRAANLSGMPLAGGTVDFTQTNPLDRPVSVTLECPSPDWAMEDAPAPFQLKPGENRQASFALRPKSPAASQPSVTATYVLAGRNGAPLKVPYTIEISRYVTMDIPIVKAITVDGSLDDWGSIPATRAATEDRVCLGRPNWTGPMDASFEVRAATDQERLFLAVRVWDDQICAQKDLKVPYNNDAVEFFWDARPADKRDGKRGKAAGQIVLMLPDKGDTLVAKVDAQKEPIKSSLQTACKPAEGGYIVEMSVPLMDLGMARPVKAGEGINIELMLDDRDEKNGKPSFTHMTTAGTGKASRQTSGYARGIFLGK